MGKVLTPHMFVLSRFPFIKVCKIKKISKYLFFPKNEIKHINANKKKTFFKFLYLGLIRYLTLLLHILIQNEKSWLCSYLQNKLFKKTII